MPVFCVVEGREIHMFWSQTCRWHCWKCWGNLGTWFIFLPETAYPTFSGKLPEPHYFFSKNSFGTTHKLKKKKSALLIYLYHKTWKKLLCLLKCLKYNIWPFRPAEAIRQDGWLQVHSGAMEKEAVQCNMLSSQGGLLAVPPALCTP